MKGETLQDTGFRSLSYSEVSTHFLLSRQQHYFLSVSGRFGIFKSCSVQLTDSNNKYFSILQSDKSIIFLSFLKVKNLPSHLELQRQIHHWENFIDAQSPRGKPSVKTRRMISTELLLIIELIIIRNTGRDNRGENVHSLRGNPDGVPLFYLPPPSPTPPNLTNYWQIVLHVDFKGLAPGTQTMSQAVSTNGFVLHGSVYFLLARYIHRSLHPEVDKIYYPPEVSSMNYCCLGVLGRNTSGPSLNSANGKKPTKILL